MSNGRWGRDEFLVTLDLYLNKSDVIVDESDPQVREVASLINRPPNSVAMRLRNYKHLDPAASKGMENTGRPCREIWEEFYGNNEELEWETEQARRRLASEDEIGDESTGVSHREVATSESTTEQTVRHGQNGFREAVLDKYNETCVLCDVDDRKLLQAGHILNWSDYDGLRGDPENGILLCYTHHKAFDISMFTISENFDLVVRPDFDSDSQFLRNTIISRDGARLEFANNPPEADYFRRHNEEQVHWWPPEAAE